MKQARIESGNFSYDPLAEITTIKDILHDRLKKEKKRFHGGFEDYVQALCIEAVRAYATGEVASPATTLACEVTLKRWYNTARKL